MKKPREPPSTDPNTMSPRKDILRQLSRAAAPEDDGGFTRPSEISGFEQDREKYQRAVNRLLQDRLIEGKRDHDGHMTIALNPHKLPEIRRELRAPWASPVVWGVLTFGGALVAFLVLSGGGVG